MRVSHKMELAKKMVLMLALVAAQAALARYFHPGERSAEEALNALAEFLTIPMWWKLYSARSNATMTNLRRRLLLRP